MKINIRKRAFSVLALIPALTAAILALLVAAPTAQADGDRRNPGILLLRGSLLGYTGPDSDANRKADYSAHFDRFSIRVVPRTAKKVWPVKHLPDPKGK